MEDASNSTANIVKIARMVVKFHPLLTVTNLIFKMILVQDWICKTLKVYWQSTMRALRDPVAEKMKKLSEALKMHLAKEATMGQPMAKLIGKHALFSATFLLLDTKLCSKYDRRGIIMQFLLFIFLDLLTYPKRWSQLGIFRGWWGCTANSISNFICFILALFFGNFYENSLRSLSVAFCITLGFLCLLIVLRLQTDLGFFGFIMGVIGSVTYNCFGLKFPTWVISCICFVLFSFKNWLDKNWLELEEDDHKLLLSSTNTLGSTGITLTLPAASVLCVFWSIFLWAVRQQRLLPEYKDWLIMVISLVIWWVRFFIFFLKNQSLQSPTNIKESIGMISTLPTATLYSSYSIFMTANGKPRLSNDYKDWMGLLTSFLLWWVRFRRFFPKASTNRRGRIISKILKVLKVPLYAPYGLSKTADGKLCVTGYKDWSSTLLDVALSPIPQHLLDLPVAAIINNSEWDLEQLIGLLPDHILQTIAAIPLLIAGHLEDSIYWYNSSQGDFSVKSAVQLLQQSCLPNIPEVGEWAWIWQLCCPEQVKLFVWLLNKERILTNSVRFDRHMAPTPVCPRCEQSPETPLHLLRDCYYSRLVWDATNSLLGDFFQLDFVPWLRKNSSKSRMGPCASDSWSSIFLATIWYLWKSRNKLIFEEQRVSPLAIVQQASKLAWEIKLAFAAQATLISKAPRWISWSPLPQNFFKLNTDGSHDHSLGKAIAGGLLRDHHGHWYHGFATNVGITTSFLAELWGCREGLKLAISLGVQQLILEMDSLLAVQQIQSWKVSAGAASVLLNDICLLLDSFSSCLVQHTLREGNYAANFMASIGHTVDLGTTLFPTPPMGISTILQSDCTGAMSLRY
ncbi:hypothetical protein SLEP1_g35733 [Rubroshorea leprosula]|uniref:RNase H type-1 domain-containing protein n=1 Tax=Rubroshorea leprosula TaxID=152421 RepID=A0AAV5KPB6_9ROSI|nr:hypothetical protein SLEP1_g35733 [Rubroshorea leprosula]